MDYLGPLLMLSGVMALGIISPGPNFVIVTSTAMRVSRSAGLLAGLGLAGASLSWTLLTVAGLGVILSHAPWVYAIIRIAGAAYLIWIGIKMILSARKPLVLAQGAADQGGWRSLRNAYLISMGNPKTIAFYGSIFSVMVPTRAPLWFYCLVVALAPVISAAWYCSLALLFSNSAVQRAFARVKTAVEAVMGVVLIGLGGKLLASH